MPERTYRVGEKVRLIKVENPSCIHKVGDVGVIVALPGAGNDHYTNMVTAIGGQYTCDFPNGKLLAPARHLAPVYDGDQPGSWDECVWKPEKEEAPA